MNILLIGAGGYGANYVKALLASEDPDITFAGVVEPYYDTCAQKPTLDAAGIPVYATPEDFYRERTADLAVIATPPFLHCAQSLCALSHGSHVLCEKPLAPTMEEANLMRKAEADAGRFLAIGYQWSYSRAIQALKRDILDGVLGRPVSMKTAISWPRSRAYYGRGVGWGGRISRDGVLILDSIASNACAHYLHNMLFLLGERMDRSAEAEELSADCYRANPIESFDTCSIRMTAAGVPLYFIASHAAGRKKDPEFLYTFENAAVTYSQSEGSRIIATFRDGTVKDYGDPFANNFIKLWDCVDAIRRGTAPICTVETATPHTALIGRLYREIPIRDFPAERVRLNEASDAYEVEGLFDAMYLAYERMAPLSETL